MREERRELEGAVDFETGKPRAKPLSYTVAWPDLSAGERARGLVFLIPGFGGDVDPAYAAALRRHVVERHGFAAVSVDYHCIHVRPETGARIVVEAREQIWLVGLARLYGLEVRDPNDLHSLCEAFRAAPTAPQVRGVLVTPGGDVQNFGLVQALDHLRVLGDLIERGPAFERRRIVALGSSHGGFIAHLIAKFAPSTLAGVIDNSAYAQPPLAYGAGGAAPEYATRLGGVEVLCRTQRAWSFDEREAPDFYGRDQDLIRDVAYPPHLEIQHRAGLDGGPRFRMVNASADGISPPEAKTRQAAFLAATGFDAQLHIVGEADLDGRLFKRLVHGLDASLGGLIDLHLPGCGLRSVEPDLIRGAVIDYPCVDQVYRFRHFDRFPYVKGERLDRFADLAAGPAVAAA